MGRRRRRRAGRRRAHRSRIAEALGAAVFRRIEKAQVELGAGVERHFRGDFVRGRYTAPDRLFYLKHIHDRSRGRTSSRVAATRT